jgi:hypothetical protein
MTSLFRHVKQRLRSLRSETSVSVSSGGSVQPITDERSEPDQQNASTAPLSFGG